MSVSATDGVGYPGAAGLSGLAAGSTSTSSTQVDKNMFLKLMVEQLKNQDPMNPTDSTQFLSQTAQFTSLEKLEAMSAASQQSLTAQLAFGASGLVGKAVTYGDATGAQQKGSVSSVRFTATGPLLKVGDSEIQFSSVLSVDG